MLTDYDAKRGRPAIVALVRDADSGEPTGGIHRTYLAGDGSDKAGMPKPKMMLGPCAGGVVMLIPMTEDGTLGIAEGIESALAAAKIFGMPVWAALSTSGMAKMAFPEGLQRLAIFADRGEAGDTAAQRLAERAAETIGVATRVFLPRSQDDFAEDLKQGLWFQGAWAQGALPPPLPEPEIIPPPTTSMPCWPQRGCCGATTATGCRDCCARRRVPGSIR